HFGFDFNPVIDRIRVVSETNQNLVLNPVTGNVELVATDLAYAVGDPNFGKDPNVVDIAYSNNFFGAASTQLYGIDTGIHRLVTVAGNTGVLQQVSNNQTGPQPGAVGGFDISGITATAYAALLPFQES